MKSNSRCHMCGNCSGFRGGAVKLAMRSPNHDIVNVAGEAPEPWETVLIVFGMMGIAVGAFLWSASPWLVMAKIHAAEFLIDNGLDSLLKVTLPWWILTDYPARNDVLTLLDGALLIAFILVVVEGEAVLVPHDAVQLPDR